MSASAAILERLGLNVDDTGAWSTAAAPSASRRFFESSNPTTGESLGRLRACDASDCHALVARAHAAFSAWRTVPAPRRGELVRSIGEALREHKDDLACLVSLEVGKITAEALGEVQEMIDMADFAVGQARMLYGRTMHSERAQHRMYEQWHPLGVTGVITAFNFPVAVWAWNAFLAAICGNTVIWKPSPLAPLCALAVQHLAARVCAKLGHADVFTLCASDVTEVAQRLVADERLPLVSFTGSVAVGRSVAEVVARRLGRTLLELSGNNAIIVDETADLDLATRAVVFGAVGTAGQRCTTTRRLLVHESQREALVARLVAAYRQVKIGDPLEPGVLMGPLITRDAVEQFRAALAEACALGGEILVGGRVLERAGNFVEPTIIRAENHWSLVQRETFAPILYVIGYRSFDEAIELQNAVPQGLSSAVFTRDLTRSERFLAATGSDCGIANVNLGTSGAEIGGAFGGEKDTGGGREAGSDAWKAYMRRQTNTINWGSALPLAQGIQFGDRE